MDNIDISGGMSLAQINRRQKLAQALSQQSLNSKPTNEFQALAAVLAGGLGQYSADKLDEQKPAAYGRLAEALSSGKPDLAMLTKELGEDAIPLWASMRPKSNLQFINQTMPDGSLAVMAGDRSTGEIAPAIMAGQQQPAQQAAPIQGVKVSDQYGMDSGEMPQLADLLQDPTGGQYPMPPAVNPPTGMLPEPTSVPLPQALPRPDVSNNPNAAQKLAEGEVANYVKATAPLTPKELEEQRKSFGQANLAFGEAKRSTDNLVKTAQEALSILEKGNAGGFASVVGEWVPESDPRALKNKVGTIKANALVKALGDMRAASPTGGAVGALSDKEGELLSALEGALDTGDPVGLKNTLQKIINDAPAVIAERESALATQYPNLYQSKPAAKAPATTAKTVKWDELP